MDGGGQRKLTAFMRPLPSNSSSPPSFNARAGVQAAAVPGPRPASAAGRAAARGVEAERAEPGAAGPGSGLDPDARREASELELESSDDVDLLEEAPHEVGHRDEAGLGAAAAAVRERDVNASGPAAPAVDRGAVVQAWQAIQQQLKPPLCKGHRVPCVIRTVKKRGPNQGRQFWCCSLPDGLPPTGRCEHFEWTRGRWAAGAAPGQGGGGRGPVKRRKG